MKSAEDFIIELRYRAVSRGSDLFDVKVKAEVLKEVVDVISTLVDEAKFNITKDAVPVRAVAPAHVAMVDLGLEGGAFEASRADECELGLDMDKIKEVLKLARSGAVIGITHEEEKNRLVLNVGNTTRGVSLVDTAGVSDPKGPSPDLPAEGTVFAGGVRQGVPASESVSDHNAPLAGPDGFEIVSAGGTDPARQ